MSALWHKVWSKQLQTNHYSTSQKISNYFTKCTNELSHKAASTIIYMPTTNFTRYCTLGRDYKNSFSSRFTRSHEWAADSSSSSTSSVIQVIGRQGSQHSMPLLSADTWYAHVLNSHVSAVTDGPCDRRPTTGMLGGGPFVCCACELYTV